MEIIKWANGKGHTIVIAPSEIPRIEQALQDAKTKFHGEGKDFEIDVSPILDKEVK